MPCYVLPTWSAVMGEEEGGNGDVVVSNGGATYSMCVCVCEREVILVILAYYLHRALIRTCVSLMGRCQKIATCLSVFVHDISFYIRAPGASYCAEVPALLCCQIWRSISTNSSKAFKTWLSSKWDIPFDASSDQISGQKCFCLFQMAALKDTFGQFFISIIHCLTLAHIKSSTVVVLKDWAC